MINKPERFISGQIFLFYMATVAVITKDQSLNNLYATLTRLAGYEAVAMDVGLGTAPSSVADFVKKNNPDLVLLSENLGINVGLWGKDRQGLEALAAIIEAIPAARVYMVSSDPSTDGEALRRGAIGYYLPGSNDTYAAFLNSNLK